MPQEQQVCSLELAKELKELGVKHESLFYWHRSYNPSTKKENDPYIVYGGEYNDKEIDFPAFTVAELGEMMRKTGRETFPHYVTGQKLWVWAYDWSDDIGFRYINASTKADARAEMLIYLLYQKQLKVEDINN